MDWVASFYGRSLMMAALLPVRDHFVFESFGNALHDEAIVSVS